MDPVTSLTPHILSSATPEDPGHVALVDRTWCLDTRDDAAFVFPTRRLAQRYADYFSAEYSGALATKSTPSRVSNLPLRGSCFFCGCVHSFACPHGCSWAHPDMIGGVTAVRVCSACVAMIRAELEAELTCQPDDPSESSGLSLGEAKGLNYGSDAFNAEMTRSGDRSHAEDLSRIAADVVHAIARQVEGAH